MSRVKYSRRKPQNRLSMFMVSLIVIMIMVVVAIKSIEIKQKIEVKVAEEQKLDQQIAEENIRSEEIEEFGKEVQTKGYIEDVAREKLGLVYEGEILFKQED